MVITMFYVSITFSLIGLLFIGTSARSITNGILDFSDEGSQREFFTQFGYLSREGRSEDDFKAAIEKYQSFFNLTVTGVVDQETAELMSVSRCQVPDFNTDGSQLGRFVFSGVKWRSTTISWKLNIISGPFDHRHLELVVNNALYEWQKPSTIKFERSFSSDALILVDLVTSDDNGNHGDDAPFGPRVLAHAFYPSNNPQGGDIHVNMRQPFFTYDQNSQSYDLFFVLVHEAGHALGLDHTNVRGAVMYPSLRPGQVYPGLSADDIAAIQFAYGVNLIWSGANFHTSSLSIIFVSMLLTFSIKNYVTCYL